MAAIFFIIITITICLANSTIIVQGNHDNNDRNTTQNDNRRNHSIP